MRFQIEKNIIINASVDRVRPLVEDFRQWNMWSPWTILEPSCRVDVHGSSLQKGSYMQWEGELIGSGRTTLSLADSHGLYYDLEFLKPWKSKAKTSFLFETVSEGTKVTWAMDSQLPFFFFFMIKMMKNMIGMDYSRGLRMLKELAERGSLNCSTTNQGIVDFQGFSFVGIQRTVAFSELPTHMSKDFEQLIKEIVHKQKKKAQHWISVYPKFDMKNMMATYIAAVSDEELKDIDLGPDYIRGKINSGRSLEIKHMGAYDFIGNAWSMGMMLMRGKKYKGRDYPFESYWNSPREVSPSELKSSVFFPVK